MNFVIGNPTYTLLPQEIYLWKGGHFQLLHETVIGIAYINRTSDGFALQAPRHTVVNGNLRIVKVMASDAGTYLCQSGDVTAQTTLTVIGM